MIKKKHFIIPAIILLITFGLIVFYNYGFINGSIEGMKSICDIDTVYYNSNTGKFQCDNKTDIMKFNMEGDFKSWH